MSEEEKRKSIRIKSSLSLQYCFDLNSQPLRWDITTIRNISDTGVCILTGKSFEPNTIIALRLKIPSQPFDSLQLNGKVIDSSESGLGSTFITRIEFCEISDSIKEMLQEYIDWVIEQEKKQ